MQKDSQLAISVGPPLGTLMFQFEKILGNGASGQVFQGYVLGSDNVKYAVKVFDQKPNEPRQYFEGRVLREYFISKQLATRLDPLAQRGVVLAVNHGLADPSQNPEVIRRRALIYPLVDMMPLTELVTQLDVLRKDRKLVLVWSLQVCALSAALATMFARLHNVGVYHRDIKLDNILVERIDPKYTGISDGMFKVIDFGNSCASDVYNNAIVDNYGQTTCLFPETPVVANYTCSLIYADPRTYVRTQMSPTPRQALRTVIARNDGAFAVQYPASLVPVLWPQFEAYSIGACIKLVVDKEARERLSLPLTFTVPNDKLYGSTYRPFPQNAPAKKFEALLEQLTSETGDHDLIKAARGFKEVETILRSYDNVRSVLSEHQPAVAAYMATLHITNQAEAARAPTPTWFQPITQVQKAATSARKRKEVPVTEPATSSSSTAQPQPPLPPPPSDEGEPEAQRRRTDVIAVPPE